MAAYTQLFALADQGGALFQQIVVACVVQADAIRTEAPPANSAQRKAWARAVLADPQGKAKQMLWAALAQNNTASIATITSASDATILAAVAAAVDLVAGP